METEELDKVNIREQQINMKHQLSSIKRGKQVPSSISVILAVVSSLALTSKLAMAAMNLPDGIENILGFVPRSTFRCERDGYFGDVDNDCRLFHLCQRQVTAQGKVEWRHWTYACGNQTMFNQLTLTCAFVDEAIPCKHASQFQYLNEVINKPSEPFLTDADVTSGFSYYNNRIMSDGARARAYEDSSLMAQLGGQPTTQSLNSNKQTRQTQDFASSSSNEDVSSSQDGQSESFQAGSFFSSSANNLQSPFEGNFLPPQAQLQQQQQEFNKQAAPVDNQANELIINHEHNFQHDSSSQASPAQHLQPIDARNGLRRDNFDTNSNFDRQLSDQFQFQSQQLSRPLGQQQQQQLPQANNPTSSAPTAGQQQQANTFGFSISTNHQLGNSDGQQNSFQTAFNQPQLFGQGNQLPNQEQPVSIVSTTTTPQAPTVTERLAPTTTTTTTTASNTNLVSTFGPLTTTTTTVAAKPVELPVATATVRFPAQAPTTTTINSITPITTSATTSSEPATVITTTASSLRKRQSARAQRQQQQQQQDRFDGGHLRGTFQSARLSSLNKQPRQQESAIVMRKSADQSQPTNRASEPIGQQQQPANSMSNFWHRSGFDSSLMPAKFESLLMRRRV